MFPVIRTLRSQCGKDLLGLCFYSSKKMLLYNNQSKITKEWGKKSFDESSESNRRQTGLVKDCLMLSKVLTRKRELKEPRIS